MMTPSPPFATATPDFMRVRAADLGFEMHDLLDSDRDADYYRHGRITKYVMPRLLDGRPAQQIRPDEHR